MALDVGSLRERVEQRGNARHDGWLGFMDELQRLFLLEARQHEHLRRPS